MKKLFIKLAKIFGFEIIDQNQFSSPTLGRELNDDLSTINEKSIVLPLGEVKISRRVKSILIIVRMNTDVEIWDQNKKRLFEQPKIEYSYRSINSLINSVKYCQSKYPSIKIKTLIIDDNSKDENLNRIEKLTKGNDIDFNSKVSLVFYWNASDSQIRIEGHAKKLKNNISDKHWSIRSPEKKALAISSHQSKVINTYEEIQKNFENTLKNTDLSKRPDYWGGYVINPFKYEFWKGNTFRINNRICFELKDNLWNKYIIQP